MLDLSVEVERWLRRIIREEITAACLSVSNKEPEQSPETVQDSLLNYETRGRILWCLHAYRISVQETWRNWILSNWKSGVVFNSETSGPFP